MGRERGRDTKYMEGTKTDKPSRTDRELGTGRGRQGGDKGRGTRQWKQACGAGCRDERRRMMGGGWGKIPVGR